MTMQLPSLLVMLYVAALASNVEGTGRTGLKSFIEKVVLGHETIGLLKSEVYNHMLS